jgi:hypothetical protein
MSAAVDVAANQIWIVMLELRGRHNASRKD